MRNSRPGIAAAILVAAAALLGHAFAGLSVGPINAFRNRLLIGDSASPSAVIPGLAEPLIRQGLVLPAGPGFDYPQAGYPSVLLEGGVYKMWYFGCDPTYACAIGYATSGDGRGWTKQGIVLSPSLPDEARGVAYPEVRKIGNTYRMWYNGFDGARYRIMEAESADGRNWTKHGLVLDAGPPGSPDSSGVSYPRVVFDGTYHMWYTTASVSPPAIMVATSTDGIAWTRKGVVLSAGPSSALDSFGVQAAGVVGIGGMYGMVYNGISNTSTSRLFFAESADGASWIRLGLALDVLPPAENLLSQATILPLSNGSWAVYYAARAGFQDIQIYLAEGPSPLQASSPSGGTLFPLVLIALLVTGGAVAIALLVFFMRAPPKRARP